MHSQLSISLRLRDKQILPMEFRRIPAARTRTLSRATLPSASVTLLSSKKHCQTCVVMFFKIASAIGPPSYGKSCRADTYSTSRVFLTLERSTRIYVYLTQTWKFHQQTYDGRAQIRGYPRINTVGKGREKERKSSASGDKSKFRRDPWRPRRGAIYWQLNFGLRTRRVNNR